MDFTPFVEDLVGTLSLTAARKITATLLKTPANLEAVLLARVQALVREALVAAVQLPEASDTRSFELIARGVLPEPPQVLNADCTGFNLVVTDYISDQQTTLHRIDTRAWFLAFGDVAQEIARTVRKGNQLEVAGWMRNSFSPNEVTGGHPNLSFVAEAFRFRRPSDQRGRHRIPANGKLDRRGGS